MEYRSYDIENILEKNAHYNVIIGFPYVGKTFKTLEYAIKQYVWKGKQFVYLRRWYEDIKGMHAKLLFEGIVNAGVISRLTHNQYNDVYYKNHKWYLCYTSQDGKRRVDKTPFCHGVALNGGVKRFYQENTAMNWCDVTTVLFDDFNVNPDMYLKNEWYIFMNIISLIIRDRTNVKIFMLANPRNRHCPYLQGMGIDVEKIPDHDITLIKNGSVTIAVEMI